MRCSYAGIWGIAKAFPVDPAAWAKPSETCGNQNDLGGEPLLTAFAIKLTGSLASHFDLTYSCFNGGWQGPYVAGATCAPGGRISAIKIDLDSRGRR